MTARPESIADQLRLEGFRQGYSEAKLANYDHAFYQGQQSAWNNAPSRLRWYLFGFLTSPTCALIAWWLA